MTGHMTLLPGTAAPALDVATVGGERFSLLGGSRDGMVLLTFYRGVHCPRCKLHIIDIKNKLARFAERGVRCVAISMDDAERAQAAYDRWELDGLTLGHSLPETAARDWGLYLTDAINEREPHRFSEPAIILIRASDMTVYSAVYGTNPFNRVHAADILEGIDAMRARDYPPRGNVA